MAQPTQTTVHVDAILTNISVAYMQNHANFVAGQVFPIVPVTKQSNVYYKYTKNDWFRDEAKPRADATESAGSGYALGTDNYLCTVYALHKDIGDQVRNNADVPLNMDRDATQWLTSRMMLREEIQWVSDYFTTGVWGTDLTPANLWSDYTASDPINDIETGKEKILSTTGFEANTLVLGYSVFRQLKNHPDIVDRHKYTSPESITTQMLAALFGVERVLVAKAIKATNAENQTGVYAFTHGKHALLCYSAPEPSLLAPSAGYRFTWTGVSDGLGENVGIKSIPMPHLGPATRIEAQIAFQDKVVATDLGYFFNGAVA